MWELSSFSPHPRTNPNLPTAPVQAHTLSKIFPSSCLLLLFSSCRNLPSTHSDLPARKKETLSNSLSGDHLDGSPFQNISCWGGFWYIPGPLKGLSAQTFPVQSSWCLLLPPHPSRNLPSPHGNQVEHCFARWACGWVTAQEHQLLVGFLIHSWALAQASCTTFLAHCS
jgi:hypothetical protein